MSKISTIMPSYLSKYDGSASDRSNKFIRAVDSWLNQVYNDKELIIISDGCDRTISLYEKCYYDYPEIKIVKLEKQPTFSGSVREAGIKIATGDIICYLDTDDYIQPSHLPNIQSRMYEAELDWCYFTDFVKISSRITNSRPCTPHSKGLIGVSNIAHLRSMNASWEGCDGYGHDFDFVQRLKAKS